MNRIERAVDQYNNRKNRRQGRFYGQDLADILALSGKDPIAAIMTATKAGYMIGYKAAKREKRK